MFKQVTTTIIGLFLLVAFAVPVMAQTSEDLVELPDGTFVLQGQEAPDGQAPEEETPVETVDETQTFVTGVAVGVAVGIVAGGAVAWFVKPSEA